MNRKRSTWKPSALVARQLRTFILANLAFVAICAGLCKLA